METKNEIVEKTWLLAKKVFVFQVASGIILPIVLFFFPRIISDKLNIGNVLIGCAALSLMFILYGVTELSIHRKKVMEKTFDDMTDEKNNTEFEYLSYSREYFHPELYVLPEELKPAIINTKAYVKFINAINGSFGCNIFGPLIFAIAGIGALGTTISNGTGYDSSVWLHANPYIAIILLGVYLYYTKRMINQFKKIWKKSFTCAGIKVNLKEEFPDIFSEWDDEYTIKEVGFVMRTNVDGETFAQQIAKNYIADIKKRQNEEIAKINKNTIVNISA